MYLKRTLLIDLLKRHSIDIALLLETFLSNDDDLYLRGNKIYRSIKPNTRKGTVIVVSNQLSLETVKVMHNTRHIRKGWIKGQVYLHN